MIWFTADTHFFHEGIRTHCNRPFASVDEMNESIIANWNECVKDGDLVYHLGDVAWWKSAVKNEIPLVIGRLKGQIYLIKGNHDKQVAKQNKNLFVSIKDMHHISHNGQTIVMNHFAMRVWHKSHHNSWHLYGHSHGELPPQGKSFDVGVDCNYFRPVSIYEVCERMKDQPDNINYI